MVVTKRILEPIRPIVSKTDYCSFRKQAWDNVGKRISVEYTLISSNSQISFKYLNIKNYIEWLTNWFLQVRTNRLKIKIHCLYELRSNDLVGGGTSPIVRFSNCCDTTLSVVRPKKDALGWLHCVVDMACHLMRSWLVKEQRRVMLTVHTWIIFFHYGWNWNRHL